MAGSVLFVQSRFQRVSRTLSGALSVGLVLLIAIGFWHGAPKPKAPSGLGDQALYLRIIDDVARGEPYYGAVVQEYRRGHYPLKPFVAVRTPVLAETMAVWPGGGATMLRILVTATLLAWAWRLHTVFRKPVLVGVGTLLLASGLISSLVDGAYAFHEAWAGTLIALSLALRTQSRWGASVAVGFLAVAVRELALPYLVVMGTVAWYEGHKREGAVWLLAIAGVAVLLTLHAHALAGYLLPSDQPSQGWLRLGGWPFVLSTARWNALLVAAPALAAVFVPLAVLGLVGWPGALGLRLALLCCGYIAAFLVFGRPENFYWGLMISPLLPLGFIALPGCLRDIYARKQTAAPLV